MQLQAHSMNQISLGKRSEAVQSTATVLACLSNTALINAALINALPNALAGSLAA